MSNNFETLYNLNSDTKKIFDFIHKYGPQTKNDLSHLTGIKLTTLNRAMEPLEENRYIIQGSIGESTGGRKPVLYDVNAAKAYVIGVDISRTYTEIILIDLKMTILYKQRFNMDETYTPDKTLKTVLESIETGLTAIKISKEKLMGVGIGTVGPLDREKGIMINPVNFEGQGWQNVQIKEMVQAHFECPVFVDNGANAAVLAEMLFGIGKGYKNLVYFHCGVGIRTGAISSDTIIRTVYNTEDAFGHMVIDVDGEACSCGNYGCIECYSSIYAIIKKISSELKKGRVSKITKPIKDITYVDICKAAADGDGLSIEILTGAAAILGTGLANFINILNPGLVILSGPLVKHSNLFYKICTEAAAKKCYINGRDKVIFIKGGHFEDNAISIGAAAMVLEHCLNSKIVE